MALTVHLIYIYIHIPAAVSPIVPCNRRTDEGESLKLRPNYEDDYEYKCSFRARDAPAAPISMHNDGLLLVPGYPEISREREREE